MTRPFTATPPIQELTLSTLANGAAEEMFGEALATVLRNIEDPNTPFKAKRSITLTFTFAVTDEERRVGSVDVECATKLAGVKGVTENIYIGKDQGRTVAVQAPTQAQLFPNPAGAPRPVDPPAAADAAAGQ